MNNDNMQVQKMSLISLDDNYPNFSHLTLKIIGRNEFLHIMGFPKLLYYLSLTIFKTTYSNIVNFKSVVESQNSMFMCKITNFWILRFIFLRHISF